MELTIERKNLNLSRNANVEYFGNNTSLFSIDVYGVSNNENIKDIPMIENEKWISLEDIKSDIKRERYCYIKFHTLNDNHKRCKVIYITHVIADEIAINPKVFEYIFQIFFKQEDRTLNNRMFLGKHEYKFTQNSFEYAKEAAEYVFELYFTYTNLLNPKYTLPYKPLMILQ